MKTAENLIRYIPERALEDALYAQGVTPTRLFRILFPVWSVEIEADVIDGEPYALIDKYLERGIAEAGLTGRDALADFLGLDRVVVDRALRFLSAIGHLAGADGSLTLTDLGVRSLREDRRYEVTRRDRRKLYFDAFASRPLIREYYDADDVTFLPGPSSADDRFQPLQSFELRGFRPEALAELARNQDRDKYNLPEPVTAPAQVGEAVLVYLPMYVIRATDPNGRPRHLVYTQVADTLEPFMTELCAQTPELTTWFETENAYGRDDGDRIRKWLTANDLDTKTLRQDGGSWQVTLPATAFGDNAPLTLSKAGSYVILRDGSLLQTRCSDRNLREQALLKRLDDYLVNRRNPAREPTESHISRLSRQLDVRTPDIPSAQALATAHGKTALAKQLSRLT